MLLESSSRVIRGGRAIKTIYWMYTKEGSKVKLHKHAKTLVYRKKLVPKLPNIADQAFSKIK